MVINTNVAAQTAATNLNNSTNMLNSALARLSSGSNFVNPADDPAGDAESISLNAQIGQTNAANGNVGNAISFLQTQNGYLQQVGSALDQMSTLAIEAQDVTKSTSERSDYQSEYSTLAGYITDTATKSFNGVSLFAGNTLNVTTDGQGTTFAMTGISLSASAYTTATAANVSTTTASVAALTAVTAAITQLGTDTATVGADTERLTYTSSELNVLSDNLSAANSAIADVDVATESTKYAADQILVQSGVSMLAQANQNPQSVLKLLQ
jgi:flagellin